MTAAASDPLLFDMERLRELATDITVQRGLAYFKEQRVTELKVEGRRLQAWVEGSVPREPYRLVIEADEDGELDISCTCPFDWEPACKHAVAGLLAYAERQATALGIVLSAAEGAIADRVRRGRTEVVVVHQGGEPGFGTWKARSLRPTGVGGSSYQVQIRSATERINHCSCPDFATNRLGTCKHIEAVLHTLSKQRRGALAKAAGKAVSVVHLAWDVPGAPRVRLRPAAVLGEEQAALLARYFDEAGLLRGPLPGAFLQLEREVAGDESVHLSDDARAYALRQAQAQEHARRAQQVRTEIRQGGGRIAGVRARLYPYQAEGVAFLAAAGRALLADDMGLGKTLQALAASHWLRQRECAERTLIVCPASLKHQWAREIERFLGLPTVTVQGPARTRLAQYRQRAPYTLVNYELVLRDFEELARELAPDLLILDEAQRIRNWRVKTADAIKRLETRFAFVLTGTPLENRLEDLYSLMQVVDREVLGPLWAFMLEFHVTDERGRVLGYRNLSELRRRLEPVMLRRDRSVVRDQLPERIEQRLDLPLSPRQKALHDDALSVAARYGDIAKRRPLTPQETQSLLAALQTARMACNAAGLVDHKTEGSPKLEELRRLLEDLCVEGGRKVVVFSQWERMTAMAEKVAQSLGLGTVRLHGRVPTQQRGDLLDRFRTQAETQVFLSTDAGGVGLNLQAASVLINLDLPFNPAVLDQRIARIHRIGQSESSLILLLVAAGSYEERVHAILQSKRHLFVNVVDADAREDVVGLSRKGLELALEALEEQGSSAPSAGEGAEGPEEAPDAAPEEASARGREGEEGGEPQAPSPVEEASAAPEPALDSTTDTTPAIAASPAPMPSADRDAEVAEVVAALQRATARRLERIVLTRFGLLALVDRAEDGDQELGQQLSGRLQVAVVDRGSLAALQRVGAVELSDAPAAFERDAAPPPNPLAALALRKLEAAEALAQRACPEEALALLAAAMVAAAARDAGEAALPDPASLPVWLYTRLVPAGILAAEEAAQILRADALARAPEVPPALLGQVLEETRRIVLRGEAVAPSPAGQHE